MKTRANRAKALAASTLSSGIGSAIGMACYLAQVPIALGYLKTEAFGLWMTIVSIVNLMLVMDFGIGNSLQNKVSESLSKGNRNYTATIARSGVLISLTVGVCLAVLCIPAIYAFDWADIFRVEDPALRGGIRPALLLTILVIALSLPLGVIPKILLGAQRGWLFGLSNAAISVMTLAGVALARWLKVDFLAFLGFALFPQVLSRVVLLPIAIDIRRQTAWLAPKEDLKSLTSLGGKFMIVQLGALVLFSAPSIIISSTLGAAALTPYNLCQRIFGIARQAQMLILNPLMASFSEAKARADISWIRRAFLFSLGLSAILSGAFCLLVVLAGPAAFALWTGSSANAPSASLIVWFAAWTFVISIASPFSTLLNGLSRMNALVIYSTITSVVALILMIYLVRERGIDGILIALFISYTCIALPAVGLDAKFAFRSLRSNKENEKHTRLRKAPEQTE